MGEKDLLYYSSRHIKTIFGISRKRLYYWRKIGLLSIGDRTNGGHCKYNFKDLVALQTIMELKDKKISTFTIKKVVEQLRVQYRDLDVPLAEKSFHVVGKEVLETDQKGSFNPLTGQSNFIKKWKMENYVIKIAKQNGINIKEKRAS